MLRHGVFVAKDYKLVKNQFRFHGIIDRGASQVFDSVSRNIFFEIYLSIIMSILIIPHDRGCIHD